MSSFQARPSAINTAKKNRILLRVARDSRASLGVSGCSSGGNGDAAGGIVFTAYLTGHLRAFDADTGAVLFELETGQATGGGIVSYSAGGRQRIGVASGMKAGIWPGTASEGRIQVFGLPNMRTVLHCLPPKDWTEPGFMGLGMIYTAMPVTNAVPAVVAAKPGIVTLADLPPVTGRVAR